MQYKGKTTADDRMKCEMFNHFFASVFTQIHQLTEDSKADAAQLNTVRNSKKDVKSVITYQEKTQATGPDNIGNIILKNLPCLSKSLTLIFQTCTKGGRYPQLWEKWDVSAIFRDRKKSEVEQYRPISLLCNISRVFERVVFNKIYNFLSANLNNAELGFRKNHSLVLQLLFYFDEIQNNYDSQKMTIYMSCTIRHQSNQQMEYRKGHESQCHKTFYLEPPKKF